MASEIDRSYLARAMEEHPEMVSGIARVRSVMWEEVAKGQFPLHLKGFTELDHVYSHPVFDFVSTDGLLLIGGQRALLTFTETKILRILCGNLNRVVSRDQLMQALAQDVALGANPQTINVHMSHIRRKIANRRDIESPIETVRGLGYRLTDPTVPNGYSNGNGNGILHP